jgi:hypothetical protein
MKYQNNNEVFGPFLSVLTNHCFGNSSNASLHIFIPRIEMPSVDILKLGTNYLPLSLLGIKNSFIYKNSRNFY